MRRATRPGARGSAAARVAPSSYSPCSIPAPTPRCRLASNDCCARPALPSAIDRDRAPGRSTTRFPHVFRRDDTRSAHGRQVVWPCQIRNQPARAEEDVSCQTEPNYRSTEPRYCGCGSTAPRTTHPSGASASKRSVQEYAAVLPIWTRCSSTCWTWSNNSPSECRIRNRIQNRGGQTCTRNAPNGYAHPDMLSDYPNLV
jgi:hypothetical protein